jgi:hypothetical protein
MATGVAEVLGGGTLNVADGLVAGSVWGPAGFGAADADVSEGFDADPITVIAEKDPVAAGVAEGQAAMVVGVGEGPGADAVAVAEGLGVAAIGVAGGQGAVRVGVAEMPAAAAVDVVEGGGTVAVGVAEGLIIA